MRFLDEISDGVIILNNADGIAFANKKILSMLGYGAEEIQGKDFSYISKDTGILNKLINKNRIKIDLYGKENNAIKAEAIISAEEVNGIRQKYIILKEIDNKLYSREDLEGFIQEAPFICAIKDNNNRYIFANKKCLQIFNMTEEEAIGKTHSEIFGEEYTPRDLEEDEQVVLSGRMKSFYKLLKFKNGESRWLEAYKIPIYDNNGDVKNILKMGKDITLRKNLSDKLTESYKKLDNLDHLLKTDAYRKELILGNFEKDILQILCAEGISIWIFDKEKEELRAELKLGVNLGKSSYKISQNKFYNIMNNNKYSQLKVLEDAIDEKLKIELLECGINYQYIFKITFNDEVLGILIASYKNKSDINNVDKEEIKKLCDQIGIITKNEILSYELRKQFEKRKEVEEELESFLNIGMDIFAKFDFEGNLITINDEGCKLLGYTKEEMLNINSKMIIHPEDLEMTLNSNIRSMQEPDKIFKVISRNLDKTGNIIWLDWRYKYNSEKNIFMGSARNITDVKILEEATSEFEKALNLESIKNEFFANISHEFKTPLNIILATMQLINRAIENGEMKFSGNLDFNRYRRSIVQNSYRLLRLVNNLIDMTRIDTGFYKLNLENYNIISIVEDITESVAQYVSDKGIVLIFDTEIEEEIIACDPDKIERIMLNLLSNAIKYTRNNGNIEVVIRKANSFIYVSVKDNGIGIPDSKIDTIFDRFVQVDNTLTRSCEGSGIGLSLVKSLVNLHGGEILVNSKVGQGTEFVFSLPIKIAESEIKTTQCNLNSKIEKCNIEFSDIYSL